MSVFYVSVCERAQHMIFIIIRCSSSSVVFLRFNRKMYDAIAIAAADFDNFLNDFANFLLPKSVMEDYVTAAGTMATT